MAKYNVNGYYRKRNGKREYVKSHKRNSNRKNRYLNGILWVIAMIIIVISLLFQFIIGNKDKYNYISK